MFCFIQLVLDSHRWVPLPAVGFPASSLGDESHEDVTPPSSLMEHPPLAVFINGEHKNLFFFEQILPKCLFYLWHNENSILIVFPRVVAAGVSAAMNELRPCAPLSLKHVLAQELVKGLQAVSDTLLRYHTTKMLKDHESLLFIKLCQAFTEVRLRFQSVYFNPQFYL